MCDYCYWDEALETAEEIMVSAEESIEDETRLAYIIEKAEAFCDLIEEDKHVTNEQRNALELLREKLEDCLE